MANFHLYVLYFEEEGFQEEPKRTDKNDEVFKTKQRPGSFDMDMSPFDEEMSPDGA